MEKLDERLEGVVKEFTEKYGTRLQRRHSMNLISCSLIVYFVGGPALIGGYHRGPIGAVVGAAVGFILLQMFRYLVRREADRRPWCRCGADWVECALVQHPAFDYVDQCKTCGRSYLMRKGWIWDEVLPSGDCLPFLRRSFWGRWRLVNQTGANPESSSSAT